jgi:RNA polymerase sigma factor (sigma-70 family)
MAPASLPSVLQNLRSLAIEDLSDKQLLQRFAGSADETALSALIQRHGKLVLSTGRRILGPEADLADLFQATFVALARKPAAVRKQSSVAGWLYGIACRLALDLKTRRTDRQKQAIDNGDILAAMRIEPGARAHERQLGQVLDEELQALPAGWRDALILCHLEGLHSEEAAQRLEWPLATVRDRLQKARDLLRRRLQCRGITLSAMGVVIALAEQAGDAAPTTLLRTTLQCALAEVVPATIAALAEAAAPATAVRA